MKYIPVISVNKIAGQWP